MALFLFGSSLLFATMYLNILLVAWVAQRRGWWRPYFALMISAFLIGAWAFIAWLIVQFFEPQSQESPIVWGVITVSVIISIGTIATWIRGFRIDSATRSACAEGWSLRKLSARVIFFVVIASGIQIWMDTHVRAQLTSLVILSKFEVEDLTFALAPAKDDAAPLYRKALDAIRADYRTEYRRRFATHDPNGRPRLEKAPEQPDVPDFFSYYWHDVVVYSGWEDSKQPYKVDYSSMRLRSFLDRNAIVRQLLVRAGEKPYCGQLISEGAWEYDNLPQSLVDFRYYLEVDAQVAIKSNDFDHALEDYLALYNLGSHLMNQGDHFLTIVGMVLRGDAERYAMKMFQTITNPSAKLLQLRMPSSISGLEIWRRNTIRNRDYWNSYLLRTYLNHDIRKGLAVAINRKEFSPAPAILYFPVLNVFFFEMAANDFARNYDSILSFPAEIKGNDFEAWSRLKEFDDDSSHLPWVRELVAPDAGNFRGELVFDIKSREFNVVLGLYRYFYSPDESGQPKGRFPRSLHELVPAHLDYIPGDPFNHNLPLSYRLTDEGCLVYSIGPNRKDDDGIDSPDERKDDIRVECLSPFRATNPVAK